VGDNGRGGTKEEDFLEGKHFGDICSKLLILRGDKCRRQLVDEAAVAGVGGFSKFLHFFGGKKAGDDVDAK
jgi:hypothetical protein